MPPNSAPSMPSMSRPHGLPQSAPKSTPTPKKTSKESKNEKSLENTVEKLTQNRNKEISSKNDTLSVKNANDSVKRAEKVENKDKDKEKEKRLENPSESNAKETKEVKALDRVTAEATESKSVTEKDKKSDNARSGVEAPAVSTSSSSPPATSSSSSTPVDPPSTVVENSSASTKEKVGLEAVSNEAAGLTSEKSPPVNGGKCVDIAQSEKDATCTDRGVEEVKSVVNEVEEKKKSERGGDSKVDSGLIVEAASGDK